MADSVVQIIMRAKDEASRQIGRVQSELHKTEEESGRAARSMQTRLALGANLARQAMWGLQTAAAALVVALATTEIRLDTLASKIAGTAGEASSDIPKIRSQIVGLMRDTGASMQDAADATETLHTAWKIFDIKDPNGLLKTLVDWKQVTNQDLTQASKDFRSVILTYFGPDADVSKVLPGLADKIFAVARAAGVDPGGLADELGRGAALYKSAFGDLNSALEFLGQLAKGTNDIQGATQAIQQFYQNVQAARDAYLNNQPPPQTQMNAFRALGLTPETVENQATSIGTLIMTAMKNAMADHKLSDSEISALGVLFGGDFASKLQNAASALQGFGDTSQKVLGDGGYKGAVESAAKVTQDNLGTTLRKLLGNMQTFAGIDWGKFLSGLRQAATWLVDALTMPSSDVQAAIGALIKNVVEHMKSAAASAADALAGAGEAVWNAILGSPKAIGNAITTAWNDTVAPAFKSWKDGVHQLGVNLWAGLRDAWTAALRGSEGITAWVKNRWHDLNTAFAYWVQQIPAIGIALIEGIKSGLEQDWHNLKDWVSTRGTDFIGWWKDKLGIHSPSRVFADIGAQTLQGFIDGLDSKQRAVYEMIQSVAGTVKSTGQGMVNDLNDLARNGWSQGWGALADTMAKGLQKMNDETQLFRKSDVDTWTGYFEEFAGLIDKYKGNVLKAMAEMVLGIIERQLVALEVQEAVAIARSVLSGGLDAAAVAGAAAAAAGIIAIEALKGKLSSLAVGTAYVPGDQVAQVHKGEMVVPRTFAEGVRRGDVTIGSGAAEQPTTVQVFMDGQMMAEVIGRHLYNGTRKLVRADLPAIG